MGDAIAILKRHEWDVALHVQGRDLDEDVKKLVALDRDTCRWMILGNYEEVEAAVGHRSRAWG